MRSFIIRFFILVGLFFSSLASAAPISNDRMFAYAEGSYPSFFPGTATNRQYQQYNYRYYPTTNTYLAIDTSGVVFLAGPTTGNVLTAVGTVEGFANAITNWEVRTVITSVTPTTIRADQPTTYTVRGNNLPSDLDFRIDDSTPYVFNECNILPVTELSGGSATERKFSCTLSYAGPAKVIIKDSSGNTLKTVDITVTSTKAPVLSTYSPGRATLNQLTTFTFSGTDLNSNMQFMLNGCIGVGELSGGSSTGRQYSCTPTTSGAMTGMITDKLTGASLGSFTVTVSGTSTSTGTGSTTSGGSDSTGGTGSTGSTGSTGGHSVAPNLSWRASPTPAFTTYVLQLCYGSYDCTPLGGSVIQDSNLNDKITNSGFQDGIRWTATSPVQQSSLNDLISQLRVVISNVWKGAKTPSTSELADVLNSALASGSSPSDVANRASKSFANRGYGNPPTSNTSTGSGTNTGASAGSCDINNYAGPTNDPQIYTLCAEAYIYKCTGDTATVARTCNYLTGVLAAYGTGQTAAQYCSAYCR